MDLRRFLNFIEGIDRKFIIHFSHIGILNSYIDKLGLKDKSIFILRNVDKLDKIGIESVTEKFARELNEDHVNLILNL